MASLSAPDPFERVQKQTHEIWLPKVVGPTQQRANGPTVAISRPGYGNATLTLPSDKQMRAGGAKIHHRRHAAWHGKRTDSIQQRMPAGGISDLYSRRHTVFGGKDVFCKDFCVERRPLAEDLQSAAENDCTIGAAQPTDLGIR
jgi:hypothetical protein